MDETTITTNNTHSNTTQSLKDGEERIPEIDQSGSKEESEKDVVEESEAIPPMNEFEKKLFDLRLKMNQARKANQKEVEEEFKRINQKSRRNRGHHEDDDDQSDEEEGARKNKKDKKKEKEDPNSLNKLLSTTAAEAEWTIARNKQKEETAATYGLNAFTSDAYYRAYEKRVEKLEKTKLSQPNSSSTEGKSSSLEINPFDYGRVNNEVSTEALDRVRQDVLDREKQRRKFSRRRMHTDAEDVDYVNEKNAQFNKKLKKSFDKYTVEIRQNLERGTAI